jgi:ribosomal protein S18 acetylase RimI-like enzyme
MIAVRAYRPTDAEPVEQIVTECTRELRAVYRPEFQAPATLSNPSPATNRVVALIGTSTIVGVAEFVTRPSVLYAQGVAVVSGYRRRGIANALLTHIAAVATDMGIPTIEVATIKETGNVAVFIRLGFHLVAERPSERFLGSNGQLVTEVTLQRHVA